MHAITSDEADYYNSPTEVTALVAPRQPLITPQMPSGRAQKYESNNVVGSVLDRIAFCESHGDLHAKNPRSTAKGKYQFLDGSWEGYGVELWGSLEEKSVWSEKDQDELAKYVYSKYGTRPWTSSKSCWGS